MANDQLFIDVLAQIERHPEFWDQTEWCCETGMCFAGWSCELAGLRWMYAANSGKCAIDNALRSPAENAANVLGIDSAHSKEGYLFGAANTLDDLYRISAELMGIDVQVLRDKVQDAVTG